MNDKQTVNLKAVTAVVYDMLEDALDDERLSEMEQAVAYGAVFLMMAAKYDHAKRECLVELAKSRAIQVLQDIKSDNDSEDLEADCGESPEAEV